MDEKVSIEPQLQDRSLLAADRVTTETRRIETDADGNVYVNVASGSITPSGTQDVNIVSSAINVPVDVQNFPLTQEVTQGTTPWIVDGSGVIQPVSGPLTDAELRATPIDVLGPLTDIELRASPIAVNFSTPVPVTQAFPAEDILTNQTLTTDGAVSLNPVFQLSHEITVVVSVTGPVTGTLPTLQFTIWNVDQNGSVFDPAMSGVITTPIVPGTFTFTVKSPHLQLNWEITGTLPSFGGVNVSAIGTQSFLVQEVDGTVNIGNFPATQPISAVSLPLPTGASTSANQTNGSQKSQVVDGSGNVWGPRTNSGSVNWMPIINLEAGTTGSAVAPRTLQVGGSDGTNLRTFSVDATGKLNINNISGTVSLPTGAATAANQATEITSLASIDAGIPSALGQTTMANSMPVVIASNQTAIPVSFTASVGTATVSRIATSTTVATALAANANRTGFIINTESGTTYVKFGSTATTTDYTVELSANSTYEYQGYKGNVTVIRSTGTGNIQVTEVI